MIRLSIPTSEVEGGEKVTLDEMAEKFIKYFASVFTEEKLSDLP